MKKTLMFLGGLAFLAGAGTLAARSVEDAVTRMAASRLMADMTGDPGARSIRGAKSLWIDVVVQKGITGPGMQSLAADIKTTDMEAQLREEGFKVMDPKKRSLAIGLRPTLSLVLMFEPKSKDNEQAFYLLIASASQECEPLGGERVAMNTWAKVSDPIIASDVAGKDVDNIRAAAKAGVKAFIEATRK